VWLQLIDNNVIGLLLVKRLSAASCALLGMSTSHAEQTSPWIVDLGVMNYIEQDRNTGVEIIARGTRETQQGGAISLAAELDVITGATPNGATSSNVPQTFTMSSGIGSYSVDANELPVDDTHMDTRLGLKADITSAITNTLTADYNALISMEFDYLAFGAGGSLSLDLDRRNTTLIAGLNVEYNRVHPVGNTPVPLAAMQAPGQLQPRSVSSRTRTGEEFSLGINQVIDRTSLAQLRFTSSRFSGYLNDSYKLLSVVDSENPASLGATQRYIFENRPSSRSMKSLYAAYRKSYNSGILDLSYRLFDDNWDVESHTLEVAYKFHLQDQYFTRPHVRLYQQDEAFFYRHSLTSGEVLPDFASADARLAEFNATTLGVEFGRNLAFDRKNSFTVEYYTQRGESSPDDAVGLQRQQNLYPSLHTLIFKYVYSMKW
jgi:hypothetical protein